METNYNVDYFIKKFEAIPEHLWIIEQRHSFKGDKHCAHGWCNLNDIKESDEESALTNVFTPLVGEAEGAAFINNGRDERYRQPTPKQRILAALYDIKKMQEPEQPKEKVKTVYVSVPESILASAPETVLS